MTQTVLVVDDERNMRRTLADILEEEGFAVATADSGEKAVKMCVQRPYDVVLLDVRMPGIDGVEAFHRIRRERRDARVIMMSAYSVLELQKEAMAAGAMAFIRKPLDVGQVIRLIRDSEPEGIGR